MFYKLCNTYPAKIKFHTKFAINKTQVHQPFIIYLQVEEYSNRIANVFKSHGYKKGDVVALFLENKPEFICTWLGLAKLGVIVPLINTNQRLNSLVHSITIAKSQAVIFGTELSDGTYYLIKRYFINSKTGR